MIIITCLMGLVCAAQLSVSNNTENNLRKVPPLRILTTTQHIRIARIYGFTVSYAPNSRPALAHNLRHQGIDNFTTVAEKSSLPQVSRFNVLYARVVTQSPSRSLFTLAVSTSASFRL